VQGKDSTMKLKINSIETRTSESKGKYAYGKATLATKNGPREVTIMSFGKQRESVSRYLRAGRNVDVSAVFDGGVVKILGPARKAAEAKAA
jgi:hypothetical protein